MTYIIGALFGIIFGAIIAGIKYLSLWRKAFRNKDEFKTNKNALMTRCLISYVINIITLLVIYLLRDVVSDYMNWIAFITATALSMSLLGKLYSVNKIGADTM